MLRPGTCPAARRAGRGQAEGRPPGDPQGDGRPPATRAPARRPCTAADTIFVMQEGSRKGRQGRKEGNAEAANAGRAEARRLRCGIPIQAEAVAGSSEKADDPGVDRKSTRLNSSHLGISYAVFCLK